jgi:Gas vesicle synthesis protein GvpL/GvpF
MAGERRLDEELRAALARRPDPDIDGLIDEAEAQARAEVAAKLKELLVEDLLERTLRALPAGEGPERGLSLVGVVPSLAAVETELVDLVRVGDLAALVSALAPGELDDPHALARRVRAHNDALLAALDAGPVVPIRFGTLFINAAEVAGWLERNEPALLAELDRLRDSAEWAFAVSVAETAEPEEAVSVGSAETYLDRRLAEGEAAALRRQELAEKAVVWHERLAATAEHALIGCGDALLDAAYLVRRSRQAEFEAALAEVQAEIDASELRARLTGPWPPFNFVDANLQ